jgi:hypothetical protein
MNINFRYQSGSILMVTLITTVILGFTLASCLHLIRTQNLSVMRSQQWNRAIPVLEAGIEEAMTHLSYNQNGHLSGNGWEEIGGAYRKERKLDDSKYVVTITPGANPVILSQGYVPAPLGNHFMEPPRTVRVVLTKTPTFTKAMAARGQIDLNGFGIRTDSFISSDPNYSTNGRYDPAKARDNGNVATNSGVVDSLNVGNAKIYGRASTGPGGGVTLGPHGVIGSKEWHGGGNNGIEPGWFADDMNVHFPDAAPPFTGGAFIPPGGLINGIQYKYILTSGNWQLSALQLTGSEKLLVLGDAVLYVTGQVSTSGQSAIVISPDSELRLYVGGPSASIGGNGIETPSVKAFQYYGLPTNTSLSISGNSEFSGAFYAPQAHLHLGGGGNNEYHFSGSIVAGSVKMNGRFNFHFDEDLENSTPVEMYVVQSWNEL